MKKIFLINFVLIISFFVVFEVLLKIFDLSSLRGISESYLINNRNVEGKIFGVNFFTDTNGMRIPFKEYKYISQNNNIILIGDSFVFGPGVKEEDTFVGKLRLYKKNFNVFNSSKPGNNLKDYFKDIKYFAQKNKNNKFYIFFNFDDFKVYENILEKKDDIEENENFMKFRSIKLINRTHNFLRSKFHSYVWLIGITTDPVKRYYLSSEKMFKNQIVIKNFNKEIDEISKFIKNENLDVTFFIVPYNYQLRRNCMQTEFVPQKKISQIFRAKDLNFFDFTSVFCNKSKNLFINYDPTHLSKNGHEIIFNYLKNL